MRVAPLLLSPPVRAAVLLLASALLWDLGGQDLTVMRWWGDANGFALRHQPWLEQYAHDGVRRVLLVVLLMGLALLALGRGPVRLWSRDERLAVGLGTLSALLVVSLVKRASLTSCPWDLTEFGGPAQYVSHWVLGLADGGGAHCFPGGHASAALAFVGVALPWLSGRQGSPRTGAWLLLALLLGGAALGAVQTLRGAHYPSHTLWTMVICYAVNGAVWWAVFRTAAARERRRLVAYQPNPMCSGK
jgi:membrane-associated PAP2 superfamily phosphatase